MRGVPLVTVNNFGAGPFIPVLSYLVACLGAFLGLRCVTRAYFYQGSTRTRWLISCRGDSGLRSGAGEPSFPPRGGPFSGATIEWSHLW